MLNEIIFYLLSGTAVLTAALMVTRRSAIHSGVFLITSLLATAGIFLQLRTQVLSIVQTVICAGVIVLYIFVFRGTQLYLELRQIQFARQHLAALLLVLALGLQAVLVFWSKGKVPGQRLPVLTAAPAEKLLLNAQAIAHELFSSYLLQVEIVFVLLLVAMIGAVVITRKKV